ncbi:hypothetical protein MMOB0120 [Mycoplasma mobile 163K]|uniref:Uncharacterized protein n=2 Tax=[Mycoplasma] mobile TaxID=2118 RepID=Q6KIS7_MYCM1|nr:hypothetical protein MMOB0120 [Mycoplasma mobile 163K]
MIFSPNGKLVNLMKYDLGDFQVQLNQNNILEKIYFKNTLLFNKVNFFGVQKSLIKEILYEKNLELLDLIEINSEWNIFEKASLIYKKNKFLKMVIVKNLDKIKNFLNLELNFYLNKNDLIIELKYKTQQRVFWSIDVSFELINNEKIYFLDKNNDLIKSSFNLKFLNENENTLIDIEYVLKIDNFYLQSSYQNVLKKDNMLIFSPLLLGKKTDILKDNQSLNTNKNFYVFRIKGN